MTRNATCSLVTVLILYEDMRNHDRTRLQGLFTLLAALTLLLSASPAQSQTLNLMPPAIADNAGMLTANFGVTVEERPVLKGELEDGAKLVMKCRVKLFKVRDYWLDSIVAKTNFESVLQFEPLSKDFILTLPNRATPLRGKDLPMLLKEGWGTIETALCPWSELTRGEKYSLQLNITLHETDAPEGLTRLLYFWSWDTGPDSTFQLEFTY